jgi:hypothetical protein
MENTNVPTCMLPITKSVRFFYYFKGKQWTTFVAGSIQGKKLWHLCFILFLQEPTCSKLWQHKFEHYFTLEHTQKYNDLKP